ncbi:MAG TPA: N-acetyltransferase [Kofleriaceae bacterium]|jgi:putative acetyltransferase
MELRAELPRDHAAVLDVHRQAFGSGGAKVAGLLEALRRDDPAALSLVAEQAGEIVGHVLFSHGLLDAPRRLVAVQVLSPLAVVPAQQRQGIGAALVRHGLQLLDARGMPAVFLEGNPRYYGRLGFAAAGPRGFRKPSLRIPDDAFQVALLSAYQPWMTGTLVYAQAFWDHDSVGLRDREPEPA